MRNALALLKLGLRLDAEDGRGHRGRPRERRSRTVKRRDPVTGLLVVITDHARRRCIERAITVDEVLELLREHDPTTCLGRRRARRLRHGELVAYAFMRRAKPDAKRRPREAHWVVMSIWRHGADRPPIQLEGIPY